MKHIIPFAIILSFFGAPYSIFGQKISYVKEQKDSIVEFFEIYDIPAVKVIASKKRLMEQIPGSGSYIDLKEIKKLQAISGNEVLRKIPGLHVVDEEGLGLRLNIGVRGLDPDRSSKVLVLEDGIPVGLNPYGEPQLYYSPTIDRMVGIEVLKGSGQILFGPQTVGGVINYITANPPKEQKYSLRLKGGPGNFYSGLIGLGNTYGQVGYQVNYLHKRADDFGATKFQLNDLSGKIQLKISDRARLGLKLGYYQETSNSTYVGLTQSLFEKKAFDQETLAKNDLLDVERLSASLVHEIHWNYKIKLQTSVFGYKTSRNWQRQNFSYSNPGNYHYVVGAADEEGSIYFLDSNGHRNRQFQVAGIAPRFTSSFGSDAFKHKMEAGIRLLHEKAFEQRINGDKGEAISGALINDEVRTGIAFSAFTQDQFFIRDRLILTAGVRLESYSFERNISRLQQVDTSLIANQNIVQLIPGFGFNYKLGSNSGLFGGVHRGFAPPRIKDAIASSGEAYQLDPELSWNFELGWRTAIDELINFELTFYQMDFSNQVIPISESSGGAGTGFVNGGRSLHQGIELGVEWKFGKLWNAKGDFSWTNNLGVLKSIYNADRFVKSPVDPSVEININGNHTPYTPGLSLTSQLDANFPFGLGINVIGNYMGSQFTDEMNSESPSANGRVGKISSKTILDGGLSFIFPNKKLELSLSVKNILDERYISTRRPQGIRVGLPRYFSGGLSLTL